MQAVAIANQKGGIGKTTTALALAHGLTNKGYKVLSIDTDPQRNMTRVFNAKVEDEYTLADIMYDNLNAAKCIQRTNLGDIIASDNLLKDADTKIAVDTDRFYHLTDSLSSIENNYDYIIFDTPPGNGVLLGNVLSYVHHLIIPVTCDSFGIQGLRDFYDTTNSFKKRINKSLNISGILRIKYKGKQNLTRDIEENILPSFAKEMNTKIFNTTIRESVRCQEAQTLQKSLYEYAPKSNTALDYMKFIEELMKEMEEI